MAAKNSHSDEVATQPPLDQQEIRATLPEGLPDLGEVKELYSQDNVPPPWVWFVMACFPVVFAGLLLHLGLSKPAGHQDRTVLFVLTGVMSVTAVGLVVTGVVLTQFPNITSRSRFLLCKGGLIHTRGTDADAFPWTELEIRKTRANPLNRAYELRRPEGRPIAVKVTPFRRKTMKAIQDAQVRFAGPKLIKAINAGNTISFGRLGINAQGLVHRKAVVPWSSIKALDFSYDQRSTQQLFLSVQIRGDSDVTLNASKELPNIWLFMDLVSRVHPPLEKFKDSQDWWLL